MTKIVALTMSSDHRKEPKLVPRWADEFLRVSLLWNDDFAGARNYALEMAQKQTNADWALWLDTDMHYSKESKIRSSLRSMGSDVGAIPLPYSGGHYSKECLIRLKPLMGKYVGRTHEFFETTARREHLSEPCFWEDDKTPEELHHKFERDLRILLEMAEEDPQNGRTYYYLGDTFYNLGQLSSAETFFITAFGVSKWDEERAWSAYRAASINFEQEDYEGALDWCLAGLKDFPSMTELYWLAGVSCFWRKEYRNAFVWGTLALHIETMATNIHFTRWGFRYTPASYEGPWNVLRYAAKSLGENEAAELLNNQYEAALARRLKQESPEPAWGQD